jgi:two-component sensor histidine kinase
MLHEKLYQTGRAAEVNLRSYVQDLLTTIFSSFCARDVNVENEIAETTVPTKKAVPLGLIINEIATNAIKYGFSAEEDSRFTVGIDEDAERGEYLLTVSNTGTPFPEDVDFQNAEGLGMQLISGLVQQLNGKVELQRRPYPVFTICFPMDRE